MPSHELCLCQLFNQQHNQIMWSLNGTHCLKMSAALLGSGRNLETAPSWVIMVTSLWLMGEFFGQIDPFPQEVPVP